MSTIAICKYLSHMSELDPVYLLFSTVILFFWIYVVRAMGICEDLTQTAGDWND